MQKTANIHGTSGGSVTVGLPDAIAYVDRWGGIKEVVTDPRILQAMWDAPDEQAKRQAIRDQLSRSKES